MRLFLFLCFGINAADFGGMCIEYGVNSQSNFHSVRRHEVTVGNVVGISLGNIEKAEVNLKRCLKSALKCAIHCTDGYASPSETRLVSE